MFRKALLFGYVYIFCLINGYSSNCVLIGNNRRALSGVIGSFNEQVENRMVGQERAIKRVRDELENKLNIIKMDDADVSDINVPLVLHFV